MEFPGVKGALRALNTTKNCSDDGPTLCLNAGDDLKRVPEKVKAAGKEVTLEKTPIDEYGFIAFIKDSEENHIDLYSMHRIARQIRGRRDPRPSCNRDLPSGT